MKERRWSFSWLNKDSLKTQDGHEYSGSLLHLPDNNTLIKTRAAIIIPSSFSSYFLQLPLSPTSKFSSWLSFLIFPLTSQNQKFPIRLPSINLLKLNQIKWEAVTQHEPSIHYQKWRMWWIRLDNLDEEEICGHEKEILEMEDNKRRYPARNRTMTIELKVVDHHHSIRSKSNGILKYSDHILTLVAANCH